MLMRRDVDWIEMGDIAARDGDGYSRFVGRNESRRLREREPASRGAG
jgi:hypothetical protein